MKMTFRGWRRELTAHKHNVAPVDFANNKYRAQAVDQAVTWNGALSALGKVTNLGLSGSFLVEFSFEKAELQSWLEKFAEAHPAEVLHMLAPIQANAIISLTKATES